MAKVRLTKEQKYLEWKRNASYVSGKVDVYKRYKTQRKPLPKDLNEERIKAIKRLHELDSPTSWIAKLYGLSRTQVYRIIYNKPNNTC